VAAATGSAFGGSRPSRRQPIAAEPAALRIIAFLGAAAVVGVLVWMIVLRWQEFIEMIPDVLPWLVVVAVADLLAVPVWGSVELMMSFPVLLASAFVFPAYIAGSLSFVATLDARELRREISVGRALFNRSNVALSVMAAAWVFESMGGDVLDWPGVVPIALVSLVVDLLINATLVLVGARLLTGLTTTRLVHNVYGGSQPFAFAGGYLCFGLLAVVLATVYKAAGTWGLIAFAIPLVLARQMFVHGKDLTAAAHQLDESRHLLTHVSNRIADERRDERLAVAAGIHDEVLPPLYKVHLMGQVLKQDLASGRLLDLEADLPDLLQATQVASSAFRDLVSDLRESTLGPGGLVATLELLVRKLSSDTRIDIELRAKRVAGTPLTHLLLYQVAREALANTVRHSGADRARVVLEDGEDCVRLFVEDNGSGFEPKLVDRERHFGLQLMRERVELAGGAFYVESSPSTGTRVIVRLPVDRGA
jgi:signal transduction histidine kinase